MYHSLNPFQCEGKQSATGAHCTGSKIIQIIQLDLFLFPTIKHIDILLTIFTRGNTIYSYSLTLWVAIKLNFAFFKQTFFDHILTTTLELYLPS